MNLELLDPFGRQIPDRVDATLDLAPHLHFRHHEVKAQSADGGGKKGKNKDSAANKAAAAAAAAAAADRDQEWKAAYHVAFNRRGTYVAVGFGSGAVGVYNILNRTLCSLYRSDDSPIELKGNGITSVSWSRRSRTLLAGAAGDSMVQVFDTTHPLGPEESCLSIDLDDNDGGGGGTGTGTSGYTSQKRKEKEKAAALAAAAAANNNPVDPNILLPTHAASVTGPTPFCDPHQGYVLVKEKRSLTSQTVVMGGELPSTKSLGMGNLPSLQDVAAARHSSSSTMLSAASALAVSSPPKSSSAKISSTTSPSKQQGKNNNSKTTSSGSSGDDVRRYPCITFAFPKPVGGSLQVNPTCPTAGLAALTNGSLLLFWFHPSAWIQSSGTTSSGRTGGSSSTGNSGTASSGGADASTGGSAGVAGAAGGETAGAASSSNISGSSGDSSRTTTTTGGSGPKVIYVPLLDASSSESSHQHFVTCASFDPHGNRVYAATKGGKILGWDVTQLMKVLSRYSGNRSSNDSDSDHAPSVLLPMVKPRFVIDIRPGNASAWHLLVSRSGKYLIINSADGALRLYSADTCWNAPETVDKPVWTFQDVVSKVKFASCDLSGEGEYVVGGANGDDNRYELYIWNTSTGALMDKLTGSNVQLYSVAWHPTRAFLAVATSDGLIDLWGPRINWTAFAPDFQALPRNVEYVEREDEFDQVVVVDDSGKNKNVDSTSNDDNDEKMDEDETPTKAPDTASATPTTATAMDVDQETAAVSVVAVDDNKTRTKMMTTTTTSHNNEEEAAMSNTIVDVQTINPVPVFASDSEEETEIFSFETKVKNLILAKLGKVKQVEKQDD